MSSHLRESTTFEAFSAHTTVASRPHSTSPPPSKKQRMTLTQTYCLAHRARGKLSHEASQGDHDLRLLVGHANLLDNLMLELQDAEREQDKWFEKSVRVAASEPKKVSFAPSVTEHFALEVPDSSDDEDMDSDSEVEQDRISHHLTVPAQSFRRQRARSPPAKPVTISYEDDEEAMDEDEDDEDLALTRTRSHSADDADMPLPELVHENDSSDESDEETPSPPADLNNYNIISKDFGADAQRHQQKLDEQAILEAMEEDDDFFQPNVQMTSPMVTCN